MQAKVNWGHSLWEKSTFMAGVGELKYVRAMKYF